jgi:DNA-binding CsgD family transcriptional regulator
MTATIYCLIDNKSNTPFYVGSAENVKARFKAHVRSSLTEQTKLYKYIRENNISFSLKELETRNFKNFGQKNKAEGVWYDKFVGDGIVLYNTHRPKGSENWKNFTDSQLIRAFSEGLTNKAVAEILGTTYNYVGFRLLVLKSIHGCKNKGHLISHFLTQGLID